MKTVGNVTIAVHDPDTRDLISRVLSGAGHKVDVTRSVTEAVQSAGNCDLLIADFELPEEGARVLCEAAKETPVLMLAPRAQTEDVEACLALGATEVVTRPFISPELLARVGTLIRLRLVERTLTEERSDFELLLEITRSISGKKTPEEILDAMVKRLSKYLKVERATIIVASRDPIWGYLMATSDPGIGPGFQIDLRKYPEVVRTLTTKKVLIIEDVATSRIVAPLRKELQKAKIVSLLALPIAPDGEPAATLLLHTRGVKRKFTLREIRLCAAAAEAAGVALRSARLFLAVRG